MALKIRLRQQGRSHRPFYRVVVADCRSPRDGKYVEAIGWYNPLESVAERNLYIKPDRVQHWLSHGAEITDKVESLIKQAAPEVLKQHQERAMQKRNKEAAKRKQRKTKA